MKVCTEHYCTRRATQGSTCTYHAVREGLEAVIPNARIAIVKDNSSPCCSSAMRRPVPVSLSKEPWL